MSSLEERREARRRRRMMEQEESETDESETISTHHLDKGMMHARREKENRLSRLAAEVNSFNEEDDYERKRRERREAREARLRSAVVEEETTSRRSRRHADEDEAPAEESRRSRRRRGYEEDEEAPAEDTSQEDTAAAAAAEEARRQQEAEEAARQAAEEERRQQEAEERRKREEEEREKREAEEALRKIENEKRAAEEAEQRKIEEEKQKAEEAERKKREAEERRKRIHEDFSQPCENEPAEFSIQSSHPYYNGNTVDDEESGDTDNDVDEQLKSDTSLETRSSPWFSDNKDIESESRSYLSSSREDVYDSHTDDGSLEDSTDNDGCSPNGFIAHENNSVEDGYSVKKGETYTQRASTLPDSDKVNVVKVDTSQFEVRQQPNKKLDIPVKNFIPYRGSNLKDIQKKFEECNLPTTEPAKRNKNERNSKGFIGSAKISTHPVINGLSKKDSNSKVEKLKEVHIQFEMAGKTSTTGAQIKNISVHNAVSLPEKRSSLANEKKSSEENINNCSKWPPERGRLVKDLSEKYLSSAIDDPDSSQDKPLVGMKSVVRCSPCAYKAEIFKTKVPESLNHYSFDQTNANKTEIKRDVLSRWPPPADPKQTARESISSAIAQKLNSKDLAGISTTNPRANHITAAPISGRWPPVSSVDKETKHSTASAENRKLREKTSKQITPLKNTSLWSQPESISPTQMHALKNPTFHNSCDSINHLTKDAAITGHHSLASTYSLNESQFKLNDFHEEEEREEAERKKRQEEAARRRQEEEEKKKKGKRKGLGGLSPEKKKLLKPPHESLPVGEKSLQLNQVHHLGLNEIDEEERKRQVLSERIIPLPDNLEELSKVPPSQFTYILCGHDNAECKLIMQKAAEDLKNEAKRKAEERENFINSRVEPLATDGLNEAQMQDLVKKLHGKMAELEEEVYDWEFKLRRQEFEINDLTLKVNDTRGKFVKPVLRKISKTEAKLAKLERTKKDDFRTTLKSSGHKYDKIEEEEAPAEEA